MAIGRKWTRDELLVVLNLYRKLSFGQLHARNPVIIELAAKLDRSANSVVMKLCNFASLDRSGQKSVRSFLHLTRGAVAAFQGAEDGSHLRIQGRGFAREEERLRDGRRQLFGKEQSAHRNVTVGAARVRVLRPVVRVAGSQFGRVGRGKEAR